MTAEDDVYLGRINNNFSKYEGHAKGAVFDFLTLLEQAAASLAHKGVVVNIEAAVGGALPRLQLQTYFGAINAEYLLTSNEEYPAYSVVFTDVDPLGKLRDLYAVSLHFERKWWDHYESDLPYDANVGPAWKTVVEIVQRVLAAKLRRNHERIDSMLT